MSDNVLQKDLHLSAPFYIIDMFLTAFHTIESMGLMKLDLYSVRLYQSLFLFLNYMHS